MPTRASGGSFVRAARRWSRRRRWVGPMTPRLSAASMGVDEEVLDFSGRVYDNPST